MLIYVFTIGFTYLGKNVIDLNVLARPMPLSLYRVYHLLKLSELFERGKIGQIAKCACHFKTAPLSTLFGIEENCLVVFLKVVSRFDM